jgi:hypothetical protein
MQTENMEKVKYSYKFASKAARPGQARREEPERAELQDIINDILGLETNKANRIRVPA